ncbi:MAG TPA: hypothetical protein VF717_03145, partial [Pyrinomonadaceae bacterium]
MSELKNCAAVLLLLMAGALPMCARHASEVKTTAAEPTIDRTSIQITTQEHRGYYANGKLDETTWSWTPRIS